MARISQSVLIAVISPATVCLGGGMKALLEHAVESVVQPGWLSWRSP